MFVRQSGSSSPETLQGCDIAVEHMLEILHGPEQSASHDAHLEANDLRVGVVFQDGPLLVAIRHAQSMAPELGGMASRGLPFDLTVEHLRPLAQISAPTRAFVEHETSCGGS
jgi:hypothetical protein